MGDLSCVCGVPRRINELYNSLYNIPTLTEQFQVLISSTVVNKLSLSHTSIFKHQCKW